jgi:hypothetical protein
MLVQASIAAAMIMKPIDLSLEIITAPRIMLHIADPVLVGA